MPRTFATATVLSLVLAATAVSGAQAEESLASKVHAAAVKACAPQASDSYPASHYGAITSTCVYMVSSATKRKLAALAEERLKSSTALNTSAN